MVKLYTRELAGYFNAPTAYVIITVFLIISGYFFAQPLFLINQATLRSFTDISPLLFSFLAPAVTMRLFAEERKSGTIEVLFTLPLNETEILIAKYLAAVTLMGAILLMTLVYPVTIFVLGRPDVGSIFTSYLALFLTASVFAAAGIFSSALTANQVVSFIIGFLLCFSLYLFGKLNMFMPGWLAPLTNFLGIDSHFANMAKGILDFRDILYYFSLIFMFLFLAQIKLWSLKYD